MNSQRGKETTNNHKLIYAIFHAKTLFETHDFKSFWKDQNWIWHLLSFTNIGLLTLFAIHIETSLYQEHTDIKSKLPSRLKQNILF